MWSFDKEPGLERRREILILLVGVVFSLTFQKYLSRNALSQETGFQGIIEAGLTILCTLVVVLLSVGTPRRFQLHPVMLLLGTYGIFIFASSVNSYDIKLSAAKGALYFCVLLTAYLLGEMSLYLAFLKGVYRGYVITLLAGLALGLIDHTRHPLFSVDNWSKRTRLALFATHPNTVSEISGLLFLLAQILPLRTRWYWQLFLLAINLLAGEKTATAAMLISTAMIFLAGHSKITRRWTATALMVTLLVLAVVWVEAGVIQTKATAIAIKNAESIYGSKVSTELQTLDGRDQVWIEDLKLVQDHLLLGFGPGGARDALIEAVSWSGQAHNGLLEAALSAGAIGSLALIGGWFAAAFGSLGRQRAWRARVFSLNFYLFALAMVGPIFDSPSYFAILVLVVVLYYALERDGTANRFRKLREDRFPVKRVVPAAVHQGGRAAVLWQDR